MEKHERLREIRIRLNLTQKQMATVFGISESGYSVIECGKRGIKNAYIDNLCHKYKVSRPYIDAGVGDMFDNDTNRRLSMYDDLNSDNKVLVINFIKALWTAQLFETATNTEDKKEM